MDTVITFRRMIIEMIIVFLFGTLTGCFQHFYQAPSIDKQFVAKSIDIPPFELRYFILHNGNDIYHLKNLNRSKEDTNLIKCYLESVSVEHKLHLVNGRGGRMRYKKRSLDTAVLNEVHVYIPFDSTVNINSNYVLSVDNIQKVEMIEQDKHRTKDSRTGSWIGITAGVLALTIIIGMTVGLSEGGYL